jgi:hypothetical protein
MKMDDGYSEISFEGRRLESGNEIFIEYFWLRGFYYFYSDFF